jgi:hypothetical protein
VSRHAGANPPDSRRTNVNDFPLPEPYNDGTPQDHADMLRDHSDLRMNGPLLDYAALAAADLIERQAAVIAAVWSLTKDTDGGDIDPDADIPVGEIRRVIADAEHQARLAAEPKETP